MIDTPQETGTTSLPEQSVPLQRTERRAHSVLAGFERFSLLFVWAAVIVVFSILEPSTFPTVDNFSTIFGSQAVILVLTLAVIIPLTAGDYDLSIAATLSLSAMVVAILNVNYHWSIYAAMICGLAVGALVGLVNGGIVVLLGIDPFVVTLGIGTFIQGVVLWISGSNTISGVSDSLVRPVIVNRFLGVPLEFYYGLGLCLFLWYVFELTPLGRRVLFTGQSRSVARLSGISVGRIRWGAFVACGVIAAGAGLVYAGTTGSADPSSGLQFLLPAYAAAFLGSTSIQPGRFGPAGAFGAVYFLITGITGLQLSGVQAFVQQLFYGGALVLAVALSQTMKRRRAGL